MYGNREKINGPDFLAVYNGVFNTSATFSSCCPSANKMYFKKLRGKAKEFEMANEAVALIIIADLHGEKPGDINDEGINTPEPFDPNATPPLTESDPEPINDEGINKPRPSVKPIRKETRGRKRKKDTE